jgi:hypothetical protein
MLFEPAVPLILQRLQDDMPPTMTTGAMRRFRLAQTLKCGLSC